MIRIAGTAALGLILTTCPEKPDGFARVAGQVLQRDGSPYTGEMSVLCWYPPDTSSSYFGGERLDAQGRYDVLLEAPAYSRPMNGEPFQFRCKVQSGPRGAAFAVRYATVPFSPARADAPTTRIDLREGEVEPPP